MVRLSAKIQFVDWWFQPDDESSHFLTFITSDMEGHDIGPDEIHLHRLGRRDSISVKNWKVWGREVPRCELVFFSQVIIIYIVLSLSLQSDNWQRRLELEERYWVDEWDTCFLIRLSRNECILSYVTKQQLHGHVSWKHFDSIHSKVTGQIWSRRWMGSWTFWNAIPDSVV